MNNHSYLIIPSNFESHFLIKSTECQLKSIDNETTFIITEKQMKEKIILKLIYSKILKKIVARYNEGNNNQNI